MSHQGMSTKEVHAERVQGVFGQLGHHQLNFGKFILGTLRSQQSEIRSIMTKWMRLSHSVAQVEEEGSSIEAVEASHKYGPEDVLNAIIEEVYRRGDEKGVKRLKHVLLKQAAPLMVEELEDFCKNKSQYLRVSSTQVDQCSNLHTSLPPIVDLYRKELPAIFQLFSSLVDKDMAGEDNDVFGVHNQASALTAVERIIVPCISSMVYTRNRLLNRFQMLVGSFLAVTDAPDTVKGFISHCGLSVTQPTTRKALESISEAAIPSARALFADKALVKVFLFDNINIYMRRRQTRITDYSTTAALTMRTILALPSTCSPRDFTQAHIRKLRDADRSAITMNDVLPDEKFLERAAEIHIARSLLDVISVADRTRSAIRRRLEELCSQHEMNLADPQATKFTCLKLLRQNEGTLEGIQAVLTETTEDVNSDADPFLVAGDLLTVRNTQAVQDAGRYEDDDSFSDTKAGKDGSLDGIRQVLRRGRTALREDKPLFNEAWEFGKHVWAGRIRAILDTERRQDPKTKLQPWKPARTRTFFAMCRRLYRKYLTAAATERARHAGDEVHAAACCYMRDWLIGAEYSAATKKGDIGRMIASERFMGMGFLGSGHHNYAHLILDRLLADKVLPSATSRILRVAQLVNRRGREGEFEGADQNHNQRADTGRASHHVLDRLEDRLSALADPARRIKEAIASAWNFPLLTRKRKSKADELDIQQIARLASDAHLFDIVSDRRLSVRVSSVSSDIEEGKLSAKAAARRDAEHEVAPFRLVDVLERGYVKLRKGGMKRNDSDTLQAQSAAARVAAQYRSAQSLLRSEEVWNEDEEEEVDGEM